MTTTFSVFYLVMFLVVNGDPITIKDEKLLFNSQQECLDYANNLLDATREILYDEPESYASAVCIGRNFQKIGDN